MLSHHCLLDCATLTGAARVALGPDLPALFCNDDAWAAHLSAPVRPSMTRYGDCLCGTVTIPGWTVRLQT